QAGPTAKRTLGSHLFRPDRDVEAPAGGKELVEPAGPKTAFLDGEESFGRDVGKGREQLPDFFHGVRLGVGALDVEENAAQAAPGPGAKEGVLDPALHGPQRAAIIEHADELAAGSQDALDFRDDPLRMIRVMDDSPGIDDIEEGVGKGQDFGVMALQLGMETFESQSPAGRFDGRVGQIEAVAIGAGTCPLEVVRSRADANLQNPLAAMTSELGHAVNVRFGFVAIVLDLPRPLRGEDGCLSRDFRLGATGLALPVGSNL